MGGEKEENWSQALVSLTIVAHRPNDGIDLFSNRIRLKQSV
jgi:hypothetical protein